MKKIEKLKPGYRNHKEELLADLKAIWPTLTPEERQEITG